MSAYNRKVLRSMCSVTGAQDTDSIMDESGYASFKGLHNSTVEAPFLLQRDSDTENCRNASNTTTTATACGLHKSTFNSIQFQSPGNSSSRNESYYNPDTTLWHQSLSLPAVSKVQLEREDNDEACGLHPLISNQLNCVAAKRRKPYCQQPIVHHSSPKKSKKKLFPPAALSPICRTRYYNGQKKLDIIGLLSNTLPALEGILAQVSSQTLDAMTQVSESWAQAVGKSQRAMERLQNHRCKMSLTKENSHAEKRVRLMSKTPKHHLVPLQPFNSIHNPNPQDNHRSVPMDDTCLLEEQIQRVKCPRCGKCSKVFYSQAAYWTPQMMRLSNPKTSHSQTLPHVYSFDKSKPPLARFYSLDEVTYSPEEKSTQLMEEPYTFGECTSVFCKFRFCAQCYCPPHPGEKCLVTELGTPSKIMMPKEKVTPPKRTQKYDSKLSRKNSLKRLNF